MSINLNSGFQTSSYSATSDYNSTLNENKAEGKKHTARKIAIAAALTTAAVAGVAYAYTKGKKTASVKETFNQAFTNFKGKISSPKTPKGIAGPTSSAGTQNIGTDTNKPSFNAADIKTNAKQKVANAGAKAKQAVGSIAEKIKKTGSSIKKAVLKTKTDVPQQPAAQQKILALPEKSSVTIQKEQDEALKKLIYPKQAQSQYPQIKYQPKGELAVIPKGGELAVIPKGELAVVPKGGELAIISKGTLSVKPQAGLPAVKQTGGKLNIYDTQAGKKSSGFADGIRDVFGGLVKKAQDNAKTLRAAAVGVAGGAAVVKAADAVSDAKKENGEQSFVIKAGDEEFKGSLSGGKAYDAEGKPMTGDISINYSNGKKTVIRYKNGVLVQSVIYSAADKDVPEAVKNYKNGKINKVCKDLRIVTEPNGEKRMVADSESTLGDVALKKVIVKDGQTVIEHYKKNIGTDGKIKGKPVLAFSVKPEVTQDGIDVKTVTIPDGDGERVVKRQERSDASRTTVLMSLTGKPISKFVMNANDEPVSYKLLMPGGKGDGVVDIKDGKLGDVENIALVDSDVDVDLNMGYSEFLSETDEESRIKVYEDEDGFITKIQSFSTIDAQTPDCETIFDKGKPVRDVFYGKKGEPVFDLKYGFKK